MAMTHLRTARYGGQALVLLLAAGVAAAGCTQALKFMKDDSAEVLSKQTIQAANPADRGPFTVKTLFYGSGTDKQREEFRTGVAIKTKAVDVTPFATVTWGRRQTALEVFRLRLEEGSPQRARLVSRGPGAFSPGAHRSWQSQLPGVFGSWVWIPG